MEKITLIQAAQILSLHPNTLKNWQKSGRLSSAEKIKVKGKDVWFLSLDEVRDIANNEQPIYQTIPDTQEPINEPTDTPQRPTTANNTQAIELWQETFLAPLQKANSELIKSNDDRTKRIEELAIEVDTLRERLRALEASQTLPQAPPAPEPSPLLSNATLRPEPPKKLRWWQF